MKEEGKHMRVFDQPRPTISPAAFRLACEKRQLAVARQAAVEHLAERDAGQTHAREHQASDGGADAVPPNGINTNSVEGLLNGTGGEAEAAAAAAEATERRALRRQHWLDKKAQLSLEKRQRKLAELLALRDAERARAKAAHAEAAAEFEAQQRADQEAAMARLADAERAVAEQAQALAALQTRLQAVSDEKHRLVLQLKGVLQLEEERVRAAAAAGPDAGPAPSGSLAEAHVHKPEAAPEGDVMGEATARVDDGDGGGLPPPPLIKQPPSPGSRQSLPPHLMQQAAAQTGVGPLQAGPGGGVPPPVQPPPIKAQPPGATFLPGPPERDAVSGGRGLPLPPHLSGSSSGGLGQREAPWGGRPR